MQIVYARQPLPEVKPLLFLAGPTPRDPDVRSWRPEALALLAELNYTGAVASPEDESEGVMTAYPDEQVRWEWAALDRADGIVFWVPRDLKTLPGFTTNVEFGLYCRSGKALLGYPKRAAKMRYLHLLAERFGVPVLHDLRELLTLAIARVAGA
jgi:nucleoside 2-deoxyribosyltransferase